MPDVSKTAKELLDLHEFSAHFLPGLIFISVLLLIFSQVGSVLFNNFNYGGLILLILIAYPVGHIIQGVGDVIEKVIIEPIFKDLKKGYQVKLKKGLVLEDFYKEAEKNPNNKIDIFKSHGKLRRGIASGIMLLLLIALLNGSFNESNYYLLIIGILISITMFWYSRRAEDREIKQALKYGSKSS